MKQPNDKQKEAIKRYNDYIAKRPDATKNQIFKATGMAHSTQVTYAENGWIKLQPELSRAELNKRTKDRWNATFK